MKVSYETNVASVHFVVSRLLFDYLPPPTHTSMQNLGHSVRSQRDGSPLDSAEAVSGCCSDSLDCDAGTETQGSSSHSGPPGLAAYTGNFPAFA